MPATDQFWRPLSTMHKVSAVSALLLVLATYLMMASDHRDEWREYQQTADELKAAQLNQQLSAIQSADYAARKAELEQQRREAEEYLKAHADELAALRAKVADLQGQVDLQARETKFMGAKRDVARARYDIGVRDGYADTDLQPMWDKYAADQAAVDRMQLELDSRKLKLTFARDELAEKTAKYDTVSDELKKLEEDADRVAKVLANVQPDGFNKFKRWLMLQPIIDGFNSPHGIKQDWLPNLKIKYGMATTARFDRCRTCHVNINDFGSGNVPSFPFGEFADGKYPHPFAAHPRPDVYLTGTSPHPMTDFGCTICHDGDGSGTSFRNAEHTPNNPAQAEQWHAEYHWHANHFWEYPMQPDRFLESTCIKCHHSVIELGVNKQYGATAPKVYEGYEIVRTYGCFGCHEISGYDGAAPIGPDLRLEPQTPEEVAKYAADLNQIAGRERKVGPSLRHVAAKTTSEFVAYWTEMPSRFRPTTRMPQFFHLSNQEDDLAQRYQPVQIAAIAAFLMANSQPLDVMQPQAGYEPSAERGKSLFATRGCLACHTYDDEAFKGATATFGPNLTKVHEKIKPGPAGFNWLYTWVRDPTRHHARTKMPNLFLEPEGAGDSYIDPAADIAAFLLQGGPREFPQLDVKEQDLDALVSLLTGFKTDGSQYQQLMANRAFPLPTEKIKGDEIELARREQDPDVLSDQEWRQRKVQYVGRKSISFYGCYGCHDIPEFEAARPIGTALQDWGRKDTTKLALEHIEEFLHHHGEAGKDAGHGPGNDSVPHVAEAAVERQINDGNASQEDLATAFFYESLIHHGRPGFIWQKLRQPRSYDFKKIETKRYDERLRMPKFPFNGEQIEAVATFVLGLVAEPPPPQYIFQPIQRKADVIEGERLLDKYNCVGCHVIDLPEVAFETNPNDSTSSIFAASERSPADYQQGLDLLLRLKPPQDGLERMPTGQPVTTPEGENIVRFKGLLFGAPDPDDDLADQEYSFDLWETLKVGDRTYFPGYKMLVPAAKLVEHKPARGGAFAEWLVPHLMETRTGGSRTLAWQSSPPPLYKEGIKVQTPWLFEFLKNPDRLRYTTVLRMPRFHMSDDEARALANYFAAADGAEYPYQSIPEQQPPYLDQQQMAFSESFPDEADGYLPESWNLLNAPLCNKCHSVGGTEYKSTDPQKDIRGPNLDRVAKRLQPDWTLLWLYKPAWITPYTSMPSVFPANQKQLPELFGGDGRQQTVATRDALMNYYRLLEAHGPVALSPAEQPAAPPAGSGGQ